MIGASKILTVSYGTFSCTLEGFDDSFSTMKAIAEYFRDLAADDRYFGAEPPTPDAEMLAKIAGREISRQVEAKIEDNGVTLRPLVHTEDVPAQVEKAPEPVAEAEPVNVAPAAVPPVIKEAPASVAVPLAEYDDAQDDARAELVTEDTPSTGDTESVAAKLRRIRAVVAKNQTAGTAAAIFSEDQHAEGFMAEAEAPEEVVEEAVEAPAAETPVNEPVEAAQTGETADAIVAEETPEETAEDANISDLMSRVSEEVNEVEEAPVDVADTTEEDEYESEDEIEDEAVSNILDAVAKDASEVDTTEAETVAKAHDEQPELIDDVDAAEDAAADVEDQPEDAGEDSIEATIIEDTPQQPVKPVRPSRARIIKVKKSDLIVEAYQDDAEDAEAEAEALDHTVEAKEARPDTLGETGLSAEDEAELLAELAEVDQDAPTVSDTVEVDAVEVETVEVETGEVDAGDVDAGIDSALRLERANRAMHDQGGAEDEAAVSRLLDETNAKLDTKESTRRRSAISHLRAAVAATVADRKFKKTNNIETPDEVDPYRTDLADVMRPQHVTAKGDSKGERPAPLILVSEQRIDRVTPSDATAMQIRPRRIVKNDMTLHEVEAGAGLDLSNLATSGDDEDSADDKGANIFADSTSFADFAEKMGASELPDLLEAAAAYTAYVEGRPHFARPQIMRQVAGFAGKDEFNREEGLRSFGQLLRQGKIIKVKRGQFEIAETTRFKPVARIAGE